MAAWTSAQKVKIRRYLGVSNLFANQDPSVEDAIVAVQAVADGGGQPDTAVQDEIVEMLAELALLEADIKTLRKRFSANRIDELDVDAVRARAALLAEGRRHVGVLSDLMGVAPRRDVFAPKEQGYELKGERNSPWI